MNFIVAVDENWNIGKGGKLLQPIPEDLKQFKSKTMGKVVVLGRKTLSTFPGKKPLAGRINIILTRQKDFFIEPSLICHSFTELFALLSLFKDDDIFIIGGGEIYKKMIPYCKVGYVTKIHKTYPADTGIINLDHEENWKIIKKDGPHHFQNDIYYTFLEYYNTKVMPITQK
ncbi:MAG: dihydrofolate reductase [Caldicoprobacterales bacterium]|jgi:dihydrofolate reductase|nr:dihydrofolate reductase [Clostridiales bacterium]